MAQHADGLGLDDSQLNYNIAQDKRVKTNQLDAKLDYWNILKCQKQYQFYVRNYFEQSAIQQ